MPIGGAMEQSRNRAGATPWCAFGVMPSARFRAHTSRIIWRPPEESLTEEITFRPLLPIPERRLHWSLRARHQAEDLRAPVFCSRRSLLVPGNQFTSLHLTF